MLKRKYLDYPRLCSPLQSRAIMRNRNSEYDTIENLLEIYVNEPIRGKNHLTVAWRTRSLIIKCPTSVANDKSNKRKKGTYTRRRDETNVPGVQSDAVQRRSASRRKRVSASRRRETRSREEGGLSRVPPRSRHGSVSRASGWFGSTYLCQDVLLSRWWRERILITRPRHVAGGSIRGGWRGF